MLETLIIRRTLTVPAPVGSPGDGAAAARQFDAALLSVGFKSSGPLLAHLSALAPESVIDSAVHILDAVRGLVGDHVEHNVYFKDFPANVPDTVEFWLGLLSAALVDAEGDQAGRTILPGVNLLALPGYGTYQHSYAEMVAAHEQFIPAVSDRVTVLHLGQSLDIEAQALYADLAGGTTPLSDDDLALLELLAVWCADGQQPAAIPMRETRAIINRVRLAHGKPLLADTVTDILRLACALSGGDVSLRSATKLRSLARRDRRVLLETLDRIVAAHPGKLADVTTYREAFKRLGERLHPHEFPQWPHAADVFAVARREKSVQPLAARIDAAFTQSDLPRALTLLAGAPGLLARSLDRAARAASSPEDAAALRDAVDRTVDRVSGRVLLSLREHLANRATPQAARIFVNRESRSWVTADERAPLDQDLVADLTGLIDRELSSRMPALGHLVVDPAIYDVALPLSGKTTASGFHVLPRGSRAPVEAGHLRFFVYWKQREQRTDFDLSGLLLDEKFGTLGWLSYTSLTGFGGAHSGDITEAPDGASEFIDLDLSRVDAAYFVPQVNVFAGEGFNEVEEAFFGYMTREEDQRGNPFEPRTVRMRSDLRGTARVALPLVFARGQDESWSAKWMQLFVRGSAWGNQVEGNRLSTALLARNIVERRYLTMRYLVDLLRERAGRFTEYQPGTEIDGFDGPVTFIGLDRPEAEVLPEGSEIFTLARLNALVPA